MKRRSNPGGIIRTFIVSLLGAATITAGFLLIRRQGRPRGRLEAAEEGRWAGERTASRISLERLRAAGF